MTPDVHRSGGSSGDTSGAMRAMTPDGARLPSGPGPHWVDMRLVCQILVVRAGSRAAGQHVQLGLNLTQDKAVVIGFAPALLKALEHLSNSAMDMMPLGGRLTLRVYRDPYVVVECCHAGTDAALDHMTRSWGAEHIQRASANPALAVESAREIILAHRGQLYERPSTGGGCVIIELPGAGGGDPYKPWRPKTR
jgi:hypothetical protein